MPINFPASRLETIDRIKTDVQAELPNTNPFLKNSFLQAQLVGYGGQIYEFYIQLQQLINEMFPTTATGDFLARWGYYLGIFLNGSTVSMGNIVAVGTIGSPINAGSFFQALNGFTYFSLLSATIDTNTVNISSLIFSAGTVTATTPDKHNFASGMTVTISGATPADYNGSFVIFVTSDFSFTYEIATSPGSASGIIISFANMAVVPVQSSGFGANQNLASGAILSPTTPISGVNSNCYVQFDEIAGGTDIESQEDFRNRIILKSQNPNTPFNAANIIDVAREINGVTRVFVEGPDLTTGNRTVLALTQSGGIARATFTLPHGLISGMFMSITGANQTDYNVSSAVILVDTSTSFIFLVGNNPTSPATGSISSQFAAVEPGQTKVLFTRDNDPNIIPTGVEVAAVFNQLLKIKPAHMASKDLIVQAPIAVPITFTFTSIFPDTPSMRIAIDANLSAFFRDATSVGTPLLAVAYNTAIFSTVDPESGLVLQNFTLSSPTGDIAIQSGQIPTYAGSNLL